MVLQIDEDAKDFLSASGYSPIYGARPLNRAIQSDLLNPLSVMILPDRVRDGEMVRITFDDPHNRLVIIPNHAGDNMDVDMGDDLCVDDIDVEEMD